MKPFFFLILLIIISFQASSQQPAKVSFYIISQQDQWQLFMGINAYNDLSDPKKKVVLIYINAGDSSCAGIPLRKQFYLSRQQGANDAAEFCADQISPHSNENEKIYLRKNGHNILMYNYKNVTSYCFALPDGCNSTGLFGQSLQFLYDNPSTGICAVDSSAQYSSWNDLVLTIKNILLFESNGFPDITLNTADTSTIINPGDNPDHIYSATLGLEAANNIAGIKEFAYQEYCTTALPINLSAADMATKSALLSILDYGRTSNSQSSEWLPSNIIFTGRNYFREIK